ncbi:major facilitator superfamily domain-containing protein [Microdochium trichocladiopsis]|uniref:Major facilitator superfamily domain-containing protein n=1 Tax=Microdochium trichocladiopsis TaxID=1682393 RepID=A0A9P8Y096_9PEZI|nr:major facilitator superfamily domain-containing protein [Microdochium trichocladiopsis]KAH7024883.1 major facilitator superfamily domain-containing protein [Microdochium trichocladiopsis]
MAGFQPCATEGDVPSDEENTPVAVDEATAADWTKAEEDAVKRKYEHDELQSPALPGTMRSANPCRDDNRLDFILLPIMALAFFALQMDRGNIANALTDTITTDLGITTNDINVGGSLLSTGIVLLEIPSNILLQRVGPHRWLSVQIVGWGLVATFQSFIHNYPGFLVTRFILGCAESGFIPGALYTLSTWYKKGESNFRISIFFLGNLLAAATVSLIGAGILSMGPRYGIAGWRWLFIIEGIITVAIGLIFFALLPPSVGQGSPWISFGKWSYFTPRETYIIKRRVLLDDPAKLHGTKIRITGTDVWKTVKDPRILVHVLISLTATTPVSAINTYGPSVIKSLGFDAVRANAMASVGQFISVVLVLVLGWLADKTNRKAPAVIFGAVWSVIAFTCLRQSSFGGWGVGRRYAAVVFSMATNSTVHILNVGWLSVNCVRPQQRSIAMAMIIMAANAAGIAGSQVFRTGDAPLYINAFTACLTLAAFLIVVIAAQGAWYFFSNRSLRKKGATSTAPVVAAEVGTTPEGQPVEVRKEWRWTW